MRVCHRWISVQRWGEPRLTRDVDLYLLTGFGQEAVFVEKLIERYEPRTEDPQAFALRNRVLLLSQMFRGRQASENGIENPKLRIPTREEVTPCLTDGASRDR